MSVNTSYTPMTLTSKGLALQSKVMAGTTLNLLRAVIGEGYLQEGQSPLDLTELVAEVPSHQYTVEADTAMVDFERHYKGDDNITYATIRVTNGDTQFFLREIGLIALDPDEGEILYAYVNFGDYASNIMAFNGVAHIARHFNFPILVRNTTSFEVNITYPAEVTYEEFEAHKTNTDNPHTIEFTEAETLANITSGERLSLIFGKIKKAIASLISHLVDESNPHNVTVEQVGAIPISAKGSAGGVAELDESGTVPSSQLPSYVDDVIECNGISAFPTTGESGKIYVDTVTNRSYRWSGSQYTEISKSLAIGTTSSTAFAGDKGQTAYEHSQQPHAPSNANYYVHPSSHSADMITETTSRRFVSDSEKSTWNGKANASHTHSISSISGLQDELKSLNDKIEALASVSTNATYMKHLLNRDNYSECSNIGDWNVTYSQYQSGSAYSDSGVLILTDANNVPEQSKTPIFFRAYSNNNDDQVEYIQELLYLDGTRYHRTKLLWWYQGGEQSNPQWSNWIDGFYREDTF